MDRDELIRTIMELYERMNEEQRAKAIGKVLEKLNREKDTDTDEPN